MELLSLGYSKKGKRGKAGKITWGVLLSLLLLLFLLSNPPRFQNVVVRTGRDILSTGDSNRARFPHEQVTRNVGLRLEARNGEMMRIGEVAAQAGVHVQTIRFYERRGLLRQPQRLRSGYRDYPPETVQVVRSIKQLQEHGFTLNEIATLQQLQGTRAVHGPELHAQMEAKLDNLEVQIRALQATRDKLKALTKQLAEDNARGALLFGLDLHAPPQSGAE